MFIIGQGPWYKGDLTGYFFLKTTWIDFCVKLSFTWEAENIRKINYYTWSGPSILATCHIWMGMHYALWCLYYFKMYGSKVKMKFSFSQGWWCDLTAAETLQISFPNKWEFSGCFSLTQYQSLDLVDDFSSHFKIHLWKKAAN